MNMHISDQTIEWAREAVSGIDPEAELKKNNCIPIPKLPGFFLCDEKTSEYALVGSLELDGKKYFLQQSF